MPVYNTQELLETLHQQTEQHIRKAISEWQNMAPIAMNRTVMPGKWSAAQCLEHLNIYGRYYLPAIETAIKRAGEKGYDATPTFKSSWLGNYFTQSMMPDEGGMPKKKMKAPANARPAEKLDAPKVVAEFIEQQERLMKLLNEAASIDLNKARVPISIAKFIRLKLGDVFLFVVAHNYRHIQQAERAIHGKASWVGKNFLAEILQQPPSIAAQLKTI